MDQPKTDEELRSALEGNRYRILECLATHGELSSSEICDLAGISDGSKHYQLSILDSWGLIMPVRRQYVGEYETGIPATALR